jgi:hypothetical protein
MLDGSQAYSLRLSYGFTLKAKAEVRPALQGASELLYEGILQAQLWFLLDSNKQILKVGDTFPSSYSATLDKGNYTLEYELRHPNRKILNGLKDAAVLLSVKLKVFFGRRKQSYFELIPASLSPSKSAITLEILKSNEAVSSAKFSEQHVRKDWCGEELKSL